MGDIIGLPVVRGVQLGVALVLLETGIRLGLADPRLAVTAIVVVLCMTGLGYWNMSALVILLLGGGIAVFQTGIPSPSPPATNGMFLFDRTDLTFAATEAGIAQLAMTLGNAALATSVLISDYFDRDISADELSSSMGVMNLTAIPFGAFPMCHGSGGVAGKYAFGARTAGANVFLGFGYLAVAIFAVAIITIYPHTILGVVLVLIALQLGRTSIRQTDNSLLVIGIGAVGVLINLGVAFVSGFFVYYALQRRGYW